MNSAKSIETLYDIINSLMGPIEAKNFVSDTLFNIISDLQEKGAPVTAESIENMLREKAIDYQVAAKNHVA